MAPTIKYPARLVVLLRDKTKEKLLAEADKKSISLAELSRRIFDKHYEE